MMRHGRGPVCLTRARQSPPRGGGGRSRLHRSPHKVEAAATGWTLPASAEMPRCLPSWGLGGDGRCQDRGFGSCVQSALGRGEEWVWVLLGGTCGQTLRQGDEKSV